MKNYIGTPERRWSARTAQQKNISAGCSKKPDISPAQPWRAETSLFPNKAAARTFDSLIPLLRGVAKAALYCAHRATTALSWGLCEQEGHLAAPRSLFQHPVRGRIVAQPRKAVETSWIYVD